MTIQETALTDLSSRERTFLVVCLCLIFLLNVASIVNKTTTSDEPTHLAAALLFAQGRLERFDDAQMPFSVLNALPVMLLADVPREEDAIWDELFPMKGAPLYAARLMTSLCSLVLAAVVYLWSRSLYGAFGGGLSLLLYTFSPNILTHSRLITTDLFATLMFTLSLYTLWSFLNHGGWKRGVACGAALGASQLAKYSCVFLYPLFLLLSVFYWIRRTRETRGPFPHAATLRNAAGYALLFLLLSVVIIQAGFLFDDVYRPLSDHEFKSDLFQSLQKHLPWFAGLPIPTPYSFLQGLDWVVYNDASGSSHGRIYLLGDLQTQGFLSYYLVAILFKVPLAGLLLFGWAVFVICLKSNRSRVWYNEIFLLVPIVWFLLYHSLFFDTQTGLRYLLPAFPLAFVLCGSAASNWEQSRGRRKALVMILLGYFAISSLSYHPHYLSYFNELIIDRKTAYKVLADSNLDWGQNYNYLLEYLEAHPEAKLNPAGPVSGRIVVGASSLVGIYPDHPADEFAWLRNNFTPTDHITYNFLVFDITDQQVRSLGLAGSTKSPPGVVSQASGALVGFVDSINGSVAPTLRAGQPIVIQGWAADSERGAPVAKVEAFVGSESVGSTGAFFDRPDVVTDKKRQDFRSSGWEIRGKLPALSPGSYTLTAKAVNGEDRVAWIIPKEFTVVGQ